MKKTKNIMRTPVSFIASVRFDVSWVSVRSSRVCAISTFSTAMVVCKFSFKKERGGRGGRQISQLQL